ncbi:hypothetical protein HMPREF9318_02144 [Streptococcus urinalis FB127-CNA-2]|uniref:Transporter, major intrinsic protein (MIP) domain protein n=1 Tax=Streptococcus urinalis 2285-97 TaxID=764291 RepID=G5KIB9_9STRE|nr:transporter, major intrinsic protein (MIP) domain protein [Streptococcus urinalis 2285-97]EKS17267.1 hypothetical protein HMPREF9318_02144 [Streptococcus urinalis FB127-CNA-2]VEF32483.1 glycerol uptake facilitator protein [Streptococcus urinalis]
MTFIGEFIGTFILVLLGNGVVAACVLNKTKAQNSGWIAIVLGWGIAVTVAVYVSGFLSGAHLNPAVTIAMAVIGNLAWNQVPVYLIAQFLGAMFASVALYLHYYPYWQETSDQSAILGSFATGPAIKHT